MFPQLPDSMVCYQTFKAWYVKNGIWLIFQFALIELAVRWGILCICGGDFFFFFLNYQFIFFAHSFIGGWFFTYRFLKAPYILKELMLLSYMLTIFCPDCCL